MKKKEAAKAKTTVKKAPKKPKKEDAKISSMVFEMSASTECDACGTRVHLDQPSNLGILLMITPMGHQRMVACSAECWNTTICQWLDGAKSLTVTVKADSSMVN